MRYDTGAPVNTFDERDPARLHELLPWELALRTADYLAHREVTGDGSELHASVVHRELHTDFMPIISDTAAYTHPVIPAADAQTLADPHRLGRHIAAIQEETEGVQSVAVLLVADQLAHREPGRTIDWHVIDPEALRAANHATNFHDTPSEPADPGLTLEETMRTAGREAFAAELERAVTTQLPAAAPGFDPADPHRRYERYWDILDHHSTAPRTDAPDRDELFEPLTTAATVEPDKAPEIGRSEEPVRALTPEQTQRDATVAIDRATADPRHEQTHRPPQVHHRPSARTNKRPDHQPVSEPPCSRRTRPDKRTPHVRRRRDRRRRRPDPRRGVRHQPPPRQSTPPTPSHTLVDALRQAPTLTVGERQDTPSLKSPLGGSSVVK